jgi:hypothetical protein
VAVCFVPVAWSAVTWLQADHWDASVVRVVAVWAQLISSAVLIVLMLVVGWIRREPASTLPPEQNGGRILSH